MSESSQCLFELKRMVENNIQHIKQNLGFYESIFFDETKMSKEFKSISHPRKLCEELEQWSTLLKKINRDIFIRCHHEFVLDSIDLNIERSENIEYCIHCHLAPEDASL